MKRKLMMLALVVACLSMLAAGTLAYFTAGSDAHNIITMGNIRVVLIETDGEGNLYPKDAVGGIMPGMSVDKIVTAENTGDNPAYIRMKVSCDVLADNGKTKLDNGCIFADFNNTDWTLRDGYYYYHTALEAGDTTEPLFTKVVFNTTMDNRYAGATVSVQVSLEAVQSQNNGSSPFEAAGWESR